MVRRTMMTLHFDLDGNLDGRKAICRSFTPLGPTPAPHTSFHLMEISTVILEGRKEEGVLHFCLPLPRYLPPAAAPRLRHLWRASGTREGLTTRATPPRACHRARAVGVSPARRMTCDVLAASCAVTWRNLRYTSLSTSLYCRAAAMSMAYNASHLATLASSYGMASPLIFNYDPEIPSFPHP